MIFNKTKNQVIVELHRDCTTIKAKALGLMFKKEKEFQPLVFHFTKEQFVPLHMLFVFFPIDVLYLNQFKEIVEIKKNLKPFSFYQPRNKAKFVVELKANTIGPKPIELGDKLTITHHSP